MNDLFRTGLFAGIACLLAIVATVTILQTRPKTDIDFELVGEAFFPDFDIEQARFLEVSALDPDSGDLRQFRVEDKNGLWVISTHHNYPAEAADRLAETTSSLIGVTRDAIQGRLSNEHALYSVVDPLADEASDPDETGTRLTLKDAQGAVLADYIIGKRVERKNGSDKRDENPQQYFYVRVPGEQQTYRVAMNIDLSARFGDWIDPDLLRLKSDDLRFLLIDNYSIKEDKLQIGGNVLVRPRLVPGKSIEIKKDSEFVPWSIAGLDQAKEEINTQKIDQITSLLDDMKITGVRPQLMIAGRPLLNPDLTLNLQGLGPVSAQNRQQLLSQAETDLAEQGFFLNTKQDTSENNRLFARMGKLQAGTAQGVKFTIYFGDVFLGDTDAIEIGKGEIEKVDDDSAGESAEDKTSANDPAEKRADENDPLSNDNDSGSQAKNRFVMVTVSFDETLLGPPLTEPTEPVKPVAPAGYKPTDQKPEDPGKKADDKKKSDQDGPPQPPAEQEKLEKFKKYEADLEKYSQDLLTYQNQKSQYERQKIERQRTTDRGKKKVKELNERFGRWYYVVEADSLTSLRLSRSDIISKKDPPTSDPPTTESPSTDLPPIPDIKFDDKGDSGQQKQPNGADKNKVDKAKSGKK